MGFISDIFGGGSSNSGSAQTTQTVVNSPPAYLQPFLTGAANNAQSAYQNYIAQGLNNPYSGPMVAGPTASDIASQNTDLSVANSISGNMNNTQGIAHNLQQSIANGMFQAPSQMAFQPMSDSSLQGAIAAQVAPLQRNLTENILPTLQSKAIASGAYGGSRQNIVNEHALNDFSTAATNAAANATLQMEEQNNQLANQNLTARIGAATTGNAQTVAADQTIPQLQNMAEQQGIDVGNLQANVGQSQRGFTAQDIAAAMQKYSAQQGAPFGGIGTLESLLNGSAGGGGTATTQVPGTGILNNLTGGINALSGAGSALSGMFNGGAASATGLPWLSQGSGISGLGNSASALMSMFGF